MNPVFLKYLGNELNLNKLEEIVYQNPELEHQVGDENYQYLIAFNYEKEKASLEMQNFLFNYVINYEEFANWYISKLINQSQINFPSENLFLYAKEHPKFLSKKTLQCKHYWTKKDFEIMWFDKITEIKKGNEIFLCPGSFENDYIGITVNKKNEIWFTTFIDEKFYFGGINMNKAIAKLLFKKYYE